MNESIPTSRIVRIRELIENADGSISLGADFDLCVEDAITHIQTGKGIALSAGRGKIPDEWLDEDFVAGGLDDIKE